MLVIDWTCPKLPCKILGMMSGDEIRSAREVRGWTQEELAARVRVGARTIGNWERGETVPKNRMGALEELFSSQKTEPNGLSVTDASDADLLLELLRRDAERRRTRGTGS